jgi:ubiquinone/menaquinone biosynthesis C-methylase UbiE
MKRRSLKQDKLARVYDTEILPIWAERFGRLLLAEARVPPSAMVLNIACGTGYPALDLLEKMDGGRIIAIDSSSALLDVARSKSEDLSGKRIFFRTEGNKDRLSFDSDVYDLTFTNLGLDEIDSPPKDALAELTRVTAPGGQVLVTLPLRGTWAEFLDIYREVLTKHDRHDTLQALGEYEETLPEPEVAIEWLEATGLKDVDLVVEEFSLLFKSSREFFFAPVIEFGPLRDWKRLAGKGQEMQDIFWFIKESIDAYFGDRAFSVTVVAGCLCGRKPEEDEEDEVREEDLPDVPPLDDDEPPADEGPLLTEAEISIHELDDNDLEVIEGGDDLDTGIRREAELPEHLRKAIAEAKDRPDD